MMILRLCAGLVLVVTGVLLLAACGQPSPQSSASRSTVSCDDLLADTIALIRSGQRGNGRDELSRTIETMRTGNCPLQWEVYADYSSVKNLAKNHGLTCWDLAQFDIAPAAKDLLREENLCTVGETGHHHSEGDPQPGGGIPWSEAADHVGYVKRVCGPLAGIGTSNDDVFLNIGRDYPDPSRFTIVIWDVGGVEPVPRGTTICTLGPITLYQGVAQIHLRSAQDVELYE